jgi:hypothetical protein
MDVKQVGEMLKSLGFNGGDVDLAVSSSEVTHETNKQKDANERLKIEVLNRLKKG